MHLRFALAALPLALAAACGGAPPSDPGSPTPGTSLAAERARPGDYNVLATLRGGDAPGIRWAPRGTPSAAVASAAASGSSPRALLAARGPAAAARAHLAGAAGTAGLAADGLDTLEPADVHDSGRGALVVRFKQRIDGAEVFRGGASVVMDRQGELVATSGTITSPRDVPEGAAFVLGAAEAVARALTDASGEGYAAGDLVAAGAANGYDTFALHAGTAAARAAVFTRAARARRVWFPMPGALEPAWFVDLGLGRLGEGDSLEYGYVLSARDGRLLFRKDLVAYEEFTYRVYASAASPHVPYDGPQGTEGTPHPTGLADGATPGWVDPVAVTLDHNPARTVNTGSASWLAAGATATSGNNADAYADLQAPDGFGSGDERGNTSGTRAFDYTYAPGQSPSEGQNRQAAVVHLFYLVNWLHDWYYDAGFDEASGNAQANNFGRGGAGGDPLRAEAQDFGGYDNANMSTPPDGASPRMQMYLWVPPTAQSVRVNAPASAALTTPAGISTEFGPAYFDRSGDVVAVLDGTAAPGDGCSALTNGAAVSGKIALVDRGNCTFVAKVKNAQTAGALGVVIRNVEVTQVLGNMASDDTPAAATITIPSMLIGLEDGAAIGAALATDTVNVTLNHPAPVLRDGDLDSAIVAHEWGHFISNRLVHDGSGLNANMAGGLGEGWSDFHALLLLVREEDALVAANAGFSGVYGVGAYASGGDYPIGAPNDAFYWAIRRVPYSTDFTRNPLTFRHIADGQAIPTETEGGVEIPVQFGAAGDFNSEVHNAGEIWGTMLWECYAALLRDTERLSFSEAQDRMKRYLVEHYKAMPADPGLLDARDALLAVALAADPADYAAFYEAFARRGAGVGAVAPNRYSADNRGVVESYVAGPYLAVGVPEVSDVSATACAQPDDDAVIDNGEVGTVTVILANEGSAALAATTATLSSSDPRVSFPGGTDVAVSATVPKLARDGVQPTASLSFQVGISGAARGDLVPISLQLPAGYLVSDAPLTVHLRVNHDEAAAASTRDDFEWSMPLAEGGWTVENGSGTVPWARVLRGPGQHTLAGPDVAGVSDVRLVSPPITLGAGAAQVTLRERHQFEGDASDAWYDGAVVEISTDGGAWMDLGAAVRYGAKAAYGGTLETASPNPLTGRNALVGKSPAYPEYAAMTIDLGTAYAGKTVRLRFRIGTDSFVGGEGMEIDDLAVTGATGTPFAALVADAHLCGTGGVVASAGLAQRATEGSTVTLDATASVAEDPEKTLAFEWQQLGGPAVTFSSATTAQPTFVAPEVQADTTLTFEVTVSDGDTESTAQTAVTVAQVNKAPIASVVAPTRVDRLAPVTLDASGSSDPDEGTVLEFTWQQTAGAGVSLVNANTAIATFTAPNVSTSTAVQFRLTVSDGLLSSEKLFAITVSAPGGGSGGGGDGGGCATGGAAGPLALLVLGLLRRGRRKQR